jgi:hypothetical protein
MSIEKLQTKVGHYQGRGWVKVSQQPFEKLCRLATATRECPTQDISPEERTIAAKLFALIGRQGKTSAATALFQSKHQVNALLDVPWSDIDWYAHHPLRPSISSMYSNLGFPDRDAVEKLERWVELNAPDNSVGKLLSSITGMQNGRGVPKADDLAKLKEWPQSG